MYTFTSFPYHHKETRHGAYRSLVGHLPIDSKLIFEFAYFACYNILYYERTHTQGTPVKDTLPSVIQQVNALTERLSSLLVKLGFPVTGVHLASSDTDADISFGDEYSLQISVYGGFSLNYWDESTKELSVISEGSSLSDLIHQCRSLEADMNGKKRTFSREGFKHDRG
jgi:hypothetical protein